MDVATLGIDVQATMDEANKALMDLANNANAAAAAAKKLSDATEKSFSTVNQNASQAAKGTQAFGDSAKAASEDVGLLARVADFFGISVTKLVTTIAGLAGALGAAFSFENFLQKSIAAAQAQAVLAARLKSTGGAAGQTMESLAQLTEELEASSVYSSEEIKAAEGVMLMFRRISGETFPKAMKAAMDLAASFNIDLTSAVRMFGRALEEPGKGLGMLQRWIGALSDPEQKLLKHFIDINDAAGAQKVLIDHVNASVAGTAVAMRQAGGATRAMQNAFSDLFILGPGIMDPFYKAVENLITKLKDPGLKAFVDMIGAGMTGAATAAVNALASLAAAAGELGNNLQKLGPYLVIIGVGLAVAFGPSALSMIASMTLAVGQFALASLVAAGPWAVLALAITAAAVLAYAFRDDINKAIGVDVVQVMKDTANWIINSFIVAYKTSIAYWNDLPDFFGDIGVESVNAMIRAWNDIKTKWSEIETFFQQSGVKIVNYFIDAWNDVKTEYNKLMLFFDQGVAGIKTTIAGWVESWKQGIQDIVTAAINLIPDWLKDFLGLGKGGAYGAGGAGAMVKGAIAAIPPQLEGAVPAPQTPPPVNPREFGPVLTPQRAMPVPGAGPTLTPELPNQYKANIDASNAEIEAMRRNQMAKDQLGAAAAALGGKLGGVKTATEKAAAAFTGALPPLGAMATGAGGAGKSAQDAFAKIVQGANDYINKQNALVGTFGKTGLAAMTYAHTQELINKAISENLTLNPQQIAQLQALGQAMGEAQMRADTSKFMADQKVATENYILQMQMESQAAWAGAQSADQLRIAYELTADARQRNLDLTPQLIASIQQEASARAAAAQNMRDETALADTAKSVFKGFFADVREGLNNGKSLWEAFGNAALNALNRIAEKLLDMALDKLWEAAFGGSGGLFGGGGGGGLFGGGLADSLINWGGGITFERLPSISLLQGGGDYQAGMPTIVGEKGPELMVPKTSGTVYNQQQLASMGAGNDNAPITINMPVTFGSDVSVGTMYRWAAEVEKRARDGAIAGIEARRKRGGTLKQAFQR